MSSAAGKGSAERWGPAWGSRAQDWALNEEQQLRTYEAAIEEFGLAAGQRVLEVGCGSGVFLRAAADRGAQVVGLDASEALIELARTRVPEADLRVGDLQFLPYDSDEFDVVVGFNSFFFAADIVAALKEAGRVAKPGAPIVIQVWGRPDRSALTALHPAIAPFLPPPDPDAPRGSELWEPGVLEGFATDAGLSPERAFDVSWAYVYASDNDLARGMLSPAGIGSYVGPEREPALRAAVLNALAPYRTADDGYRLENEWHTLIARAS
jgi:SAM-dependent methyltransferase